MLFILCLLKVNKFQDVLNGGTGLYWWDKCPLVAPFPPITETPVPIPGLARLTFKMLQISKYNFNTSVSRKIPSLVPSSL